MSTGMPRPLSATDIVLPSACKRHDDPRRVPVHHLVDRVVDDLPEQVMKPRLVDAADVHARPAPDGLQAFEHRDRFGGIGSS